LYDPSKGEFMQEIVIRVVIEREPTVFVEKPSYVKAGCGRVKLGRPIRREEIESFIGDLLEKKGSYTTEEVRGELENNFEFCDSDCADDGTMIRWKHKTLSAIHRMKRSDKIKKLRGVVELNK
jgi:hypothetical protein